MIENIPVSALKVGDILHYNTKECIRSTKASRGYNAYNPIKSITASSTSTVKIKLTVGDELIKLPTDTVQVEREEAGYTLQPYKRPGKYRGVSIE